MAKTSGFKIVATEGATVDGRAISAQWITDMASAYSVDEYAALIWPEHSRSRWDKFEGKNWGIVEQLKAEKRGGKLRLLAKITPNEHLLKANKDGQKLFTSIEPNPDYKGQGNCYLMGLAVTDSPASSGTTLLTFSTGNGNDKSVETSQLEALDLSECFTPSNPLAAAFSTIANYFQSGGQLPDIETSTEPEENDVTKEELAAEMQTHFSRFNTNLLTELEQKFSLKAQPQAPAEETPAEDAPQPFSVAQFSQALEKQLKPLTDKVDGLETKFNQLSQEVPGQRPGEEGAGETNVEVY